MIFIVTKNRARRKFADDWRSLAQMYMPPLTPMSWPVM
jgi:hypothetical protein